MPINNKTAKKILIIGGGFAGVSTAQNLARQLPGAQIRIVSDKSHFEYHAALYRVVTGRSPLEVCIPLVEIFKELPIESVNDRIEMVDLSGKIATGSSGVTYEFDYIVLALGSETAYFNIPGLRELSFGFKSIHEALRLKRHLHEVFESCKLGTTDQKVCAAHLVVIGGGASGVELAGELAMYTKELARIHQIEPALVTIDLIEAAPRLLPIMSEDVSQRAHERLHQLGVNIFLNRTVIEEEISEVKLKDMELKTETVIWTAGVSANGLYKKIPGLEFDKRGRVLVDNHLQAQGQSGVFVAGDGASTPFSGMAQTAIHDGQIIAQSIKALIQERTMPEYSPKKPLYSIPIGPGWAATVIGGLKFYGAVGWFLRRLADFRFFTSILPLPKAITAFRQGKMLCESCDICEVVE